MQIFYSPDLSGNLYTLSEEESKHCVRVLRMQNGEKVGLIDGKGNFYIAEIVDNHVKRCVLEIVEINAFYGKRDYYLHIAIAPTKDMERFEWFLEKSTEIGIDEITPIITTRTERKFFKTERSSKIIISAIKQSCNAYLPLLNEPVDYKNFISNQFKQKKFIAHCMCGEKKYLKDIYQKSEHAIVLIGPEGDFNQDELELAKKHNFVEISLGESRLRTETAGIVACHSIAMLNL